MFGDGRRKGERGGRIVGRKGREIKKKEKRDQQYPFCHGEPMLWLLVRSRSGESGYHPAPSTAHQSGVTHCLGSQPCATPLHLSVLPWLWEVFSQVRVDLNEHIPAPRWCVYKQAPQSPKVQEPAGYSNLLPSPIPAELDYIAQAGILMSLMVCWGLASCSQWRQKAIFLCAWVKSP